MYLKKYNSSVKTLEHVDMLIKNEQYKSAYEELNHLQSTNNIKSLFEKSSEKLNIIKEASIAKYLAGLNLIISDKANNYTNVEKYFKSYLLDFPFSSSIENVNLILDKIGRYEQVIKQIEDIEKNKKMLELNKELIATLEEHINEAKGVHDLADKAINQKDTNSLNTLLNLWEEKRKYYNSIVDDINSIKIEYFDYLIFTEEEYDNIKYLIVSAFVPAEGVYNFIVYNMDDANDQKLIRESWRKYNELKPQVESCINDKNLIIADKYSEWDKLLQEKDNLIKDINSFSKREV